MCDTIVALGNCTKDSSTLFGKNSDREPDEVQNIRVIARSQHGPGEKVECTYMSLPQSDETFRVLLCQPFWMFGSEMGANEFGVVIGNEAVFTKEKPDAKGLLGMDILRLALERSRSAKDARDEIIRLIEDYGQGGRSGYRQNIKYMNSFLIADADEAYVLETVKTWWAWKRVEESWSISNIISLEQDFDDCSPGLIENAIKKGYTRTESEFNFRKAYSDLIYTWGARGAPRQSRSRSLLKEKRGELTTRDFMEILRDHGEDPGWRPDRQRRGTICMHATNKLTRPSDSVCSLVANIRRDKKSFYTTASANTCMSPFFPVFFPDADLPSGYKDGKADYDPESFWWESEALHRKALFRFSGALDAIRPMLEDFETNMVEGFESGKEPQTQDTLDRYFSEAKNLMKEWGYGLDKIEPEKQRWLFRRYWKNYNRLNKIPDA